MLRVTPTCVIRLDELEWRTTGSGGPGRPARQHLGHARRGAVPDRDATVAGAAPTRPAARAARTGRAARSASDSRVAGPQPRAGAGAAPLPAGGRAPRRQAAARRPSRRVRRSRPASTPSAARRNGSRAGAGPLTTTEARADACRASRLRSCTRCTSSPPSSGSCSPSCLLFLVADSAVRTFVLPRGATPLVSRTTFIGLRGVFDAIASSGAQLRRARLGDGAVRPRRPAAPARGLDADGARRLHGHLPRAGRAGLRARPSR